MSYVEEINEWLRDSIRQDAIDAGVDSEAYLWIVEALAEKIREQWKRPSDA